MRELKLSRVRTVLEELEYPITNGDAREQLSDVTVLFADGEEELVAVVARSNTDRFQSVDDLETEIYNHLPIEVGGEPAQSEGDA